MRRSRILSLLQFVVLHIIDLHCCFCTLLHRHYCFCTLLICMLLLHSSSLKIVHGIAIWKCFFIQFGVTVVFLFNSVLERVFYSIWSVHFFDSLCCSLPTQHDDNCACSTLSMRLAPATTQLRLRPKQNPVPLHMQGMHHFSLGSVSRMPGAP